jgi:putative transposase
MEFIQGNIYHIYNRGNNKRRVFFNQRNYLYFIEKMKRYICANGDLLAWTLMPNHFHFLIHANEETCRLVRHTPVEINALTEGIRLLLSSYTKGIQRQERFTGNLFQQKTKSKCVNYDEQDYSVTAFHYIHQNAYRAGLVEKMEDWRFSSLPEFCVNTSRRRPAFEICNRKLACKLLDLNQKTILKDTFEVMPDETFCL